MLNYNQIHSSSDYLKNKSQKYNQNKFYLLFKNLTLFWHFNTQTMQNFILNDS
jgi:hypothetical protein